MSFFDEIIFVSGYGYDCSIPFDSSFNKIICSCEFKVPHRYVHIEDNACFENVKNKIIVFVIQPERIKKIKINKNNNLFILWCLEPFKDDDKEVELVGYKKYVIRADEIKQIIHGDFIDHVLFYNKNQVDFVSGRKSSFLPIGCPVGNFMSQTKIVKKNNSVVFVGTKTNYRKNFLNKIVLKNKRIIRVVPASCFDGGSFQQDVINSCNFSIDIAPFGFYFLKHHVRWHRLVLSALGGNVVFSDSVLDQFGFKNGIDYFYIHRPSDLLDIYKDLLGNKNKTLGIQNNFRNKMFKNYNMCELIKNCFKNIGIDL